MKRNLLSPAHAAWLADTVARNRDRFAGFTMELDPSDPPADPPADPAAGFPANTPVKEMTAEQRAAYYEDKANKHEGRNKELLRITGGKYGNDLKAEFDQLEQLRDKDRTDGERAVEQAKQDGRTSALAELGPSAARTVLEFALGHDPETNDQSTLIETLDLSKVLSDDGTIDTAKVRALVAAIAPADKGTGKRDPDYGGGKRSLRPSTGTATGRDLYEARRNKSTSK